MRMIEDRPAEVVTQAVALALGQLPAELRRSLTWDQGKEMALHRQVGDEAVNLTRLHRDGADSSDQWGMPVLSCDKTGRASTPPTRVAHRFAADDVPAHGLLHARTSPGPTTLRVHSPNGLAAVAVEPSEATTRTGPWDDPLPPSIRRLPGTWHLAPGTWHLAPGTWPRPPPRPRARCRWQDKQVADL